MIKNLPPIAGDARDTGSVPGLGRSSEGGNGDPLQYSCLENPKDRAAWQATVHAVKRSQTRLIIHTHPTTHTFKRITTSLQRTYFSSNGTAGTFLQKIGRKP